MEYLCRVPLQIISPQNNSPVMGINQDALVGAYLMTDDSVRLSRLQFMQLMLTNSNFDGVIPEPSREDGLYTGKEALSMILPDFSATYEGGVEIRDGVLTKGRLTKKHLGESNDSIHHRLFNDYDADEALRFLDNEQQIVNSWLMNYSGFSVGVSDCILEDDARAAVTEAIETRLLDAFNLVNDAREGKLENKFLKTELEEFDEQLTLLLVNIREETKPDDKIRGKSSNRFLAMQKAGSKGKLENLIQIMACLGQQQVAVKQPSGVTKTQRIPYNYGKIRGGYDGRTLPHFHRHDDGPFARGFCKGSFLHGLNPHEFFFHNATGREGLIDTAIKTADTGYLQRRLIKLMEDGKIYYDGTVRTNSRLILQFAYGCDGMDPTKLEKDEECRVVYNMNDFDMQRMFKMSILADWETIVDADVQKEIRADKDLEELLDDEFERIYAGRDILRNEIFKHPVTPISLSSVQETVVATYLPVNMKRLIENAVHKFRVQRPLTDLSPRYVIEEVEKLVADITAVPQDASEYLQDVVSNNFVLPRIVIRLHLACKRVLTEYRLTRDMFDYIILSIRTRYLTSVAPPGDMVGIIAAQSLGQPTTQMVLNSVEYGTELLLKVDGKLRRVKIGEYVDDKLAQLPEAQIERHPQDTLLGWTKERDIEILSCDEDGKVDWQKVEAVTRHPVVNKDGSDTLLKVTLHSGREVTATKGKSFLKRQDNKIKPTLGEDLKVGDYLPVSNILPIPYRIDHLDLREYLPPTEWLYTSEVEKALEWRKGHGKFWWKGHGGTRFPGGIGTVFKLPYTRSDAFVEAFVGTPSGAPKRAKYCQSDCVYPAMATLQSAHIPEQMPLDEETGFLAGIYLAEGNCTPHHLMISNLDDDINERVHHCFKRWGVNYHIIDEERPPNGRTKTLRSHSMVLTHLFLKLFGTGSHLKRVAPELLAAPDPFLKGLIGGYFDGDGCLTGKNIISAYSASHGMLEDLQQVLTRFGIRCSVRQMSEKAYAASLVRQPKAKRGWTLTINSAETTRFQRLFTMTIRTKQRALEGFNSKLAYGHLDIVPDVITETWGTTTIKRSAIKDLKYRASNPADLKVLQDIQAETIMYDRVMKIEEVFNAHNWVYDLTVELTRSFNLWNGLSVFDTFHSSGILQEFNVVDGVPRLEELLSASKNPKAPTITIFLREEVAVDEERAQRVRDKLRQTSMSDLAVQSEIVYDPSDENSLVSGDVGFLKSFYTFMREEHCTHDSPWVLRIELDRAQLLERHIRMWEVEAKLLERFGSSLTCIFADDNADRLTIRLRVTNDSTSQGNDANRDDDVLYLLKQLETSVMKMVLRGVDNVAAAFLPARESRPRMRSVQGDGSMKSPDDKREVVIIAQQAAQAGSSSLLQILKMPEVDQYRTTTTNIRDVFELLGIEAARNVLMREILKVYSSAYINYRHIEMLIDTMTCTGEWIAMNRFGINHIQSSALSRASFEETENHFTNAAAFAEYDAMTGVSGACMCAQAFRGGTGECDVLLDEDMIREFAGGDDAESEALAPIAEGDEGGADEDMPDIGIDFSIDPNVQAPFAFTPGVAVTVV